MSLFLKIFLWFWGAMALLGLSVLVFRVTAPNDLVIPPGRMLLSDSLRAYGWEAVSVYKTKGRKDLATYLRKLEQRTRVRAYLSDPTGHELGPRRPTRELRGLQERARGSARDGAADPVIALFTTDIAAAQPVKKRDGIYVLSGTMQRSLLPATYMDPEVRALRLITVVLVTGLVCFALARYLAAPVSRVRKTAQLIAAGDLSARVNATRPMGGRDEISALARDFDRMADRLESVVTAQQRLLGDVSHELRSPLARLNLALELARRGDEAKKEAALERIERESIRLNALIEELLTLAKLESGLRSAPVPVDLTALCAEIAADAEFEATKRAIQVEFETPLTTAIVQGDAEMLRRAVENITRNAIRHTEDGSVVSLTLTQEDNGYSLQVRDHGPGVPEEQLDAIFRPFYRVEDARERAAGESGTGLGLAIARRAVRAHGGEIRARNAPDGGLIVEIELHGVKEKAKVLAVRS